LDKQNSSDSKMKKALFDRDLRATVISQRTQTMKDAAEVNYTEIIQK
jgi:hypothetical protein